MLEAFILRWGYLAVGAGTILEGEVVLIAAGAIARRGLLSLPLVMLVAFLAAVCSDQIWFRIGRRAGRSLLGRSERWRARSRRAERWLARGPIFVVGFRFIYGTRIAAPLLLGATGYSAGRFLLLNVAGAAAWAAAYGGIGWALGASLESALQRTARVEELLAAAVALAVLVWIGGRMIRRRRRDDGQQASQSRPAP